MRVALPDRPGSLGAVASALGTVSADIVAVEIVEKFEGYAIDDFMLHLPAGALADSLVTACRNIPDVEVLWLSYYPETWGLLADVDVLNDMSEHPGEAERILVDAAPQTFHVTWALMVDRDRGTVLHRSELAPDLTDEQVDVLGDLTTLSARELPDGWLPHWNDTLLAIAPVRYGAHSVVLGRNGGPEFLKSELARLSHLAALTNVS
ncbi:ACT domain-containing protein [Nigerium massiliense]|uniref:amino acid-binding protein n=1 Tax=Nigerium massiliense TaxID=1522317 RepID=UPI001F3A2DEE|nr:amino acid-binding protein [Nigerium massiliense]